MNHFIRLLVILLFYLPIQSFCQTSFKMTVDARHYYITASLNGHDGTSIFVETGLPGILINAENYKKYFTDSLFEPVDSGYTEIKSLSGSHEVQDIRRGKVLIGDAAYEGTIYIVDTYDKIGVPVHLLKNEKDSTSNLVRIDFKDSTLAFVSKESLAGLKLHQYKMKEIMPMPIIETSLWLCVTEGHEGTLKGTFVLDLGNGSPLFLFYRNAKVSDFLKNNRFAIYPAKDKNGRNMGHGIIANVCKIGDRAVKKVSIGVTDKIKISETMGCIGPSMFSQGYIIFDNKERLVYYE